MPETKDIITAIFNNWMEGPASHYHLADKDIYRASNANTPKRGPLNPFLKNDADVHIKFGGFLEQELLNSGVRLTVRSELKPKQDGTSYCCTDLSIHEVPNDLSSTVSDEGLDAEWGCAVIQVRFIDYPASKENTYDYVHFLADFECLLEPKNKVDKFLLIIDEGESMNASVIGDLKKMARECEVTLLSNNEFLSSDCF